MEEPQEDPLEVHCFCLCDVCTVGGLLAVSNSVDRITVCSLLSWLSSEHALCTLLSFIRDTAFSVFGVLV